MKDNKSLYQDSSIGTTALTLLISFLMIGVSLYLTNHYFAVKFPTGLESGALCNFNSFFNCDKTTLSPLGVIFGVPTSVFGAIIGALVLFGAIFKNLEFERTIYFTLIVNIVGCIVLFCYSLFALGGLCPMCTVYYVLSAGMLFLFFKKSSDYKPNVGVLGLLLVSTLIIGFLFRQNIHSKLSAQSSIANDLIKQYYALPNLGTPSVRSEFKLASAENAPIKMHVFSDFQCPACKMLATQLHNIAEIYKGKIDIEYFFYPLDVACNAAMERPLHEFACEAAYISVCSSANFGKLHDEFFAGQEKMNAEFLNGVAKRENVLDCIKDPKTKEKVVNLINAAGPFNVKSTPTYLINGVKIEGVLPQDQIQAILDEIIRRNATK